MIQNIEAVARLEEDSRRNRKPLARIGEAIGSFTGTMLFVFLHIIWFGGWMVINTGHVPAIPVFDPYPFIFLNMAVSLEGVLLTTFVLIKQNGMNKRADQRAQLDLQINLLAEKEATKTLQLLQRICERMGLEQAAADEEVQELSQNTAVASLARELDQKLPQE